MPRWQIWSGVSPPISSPRRRTEPAVGGRAPDTQLISVVFPEPLGPISPRISPSRTSNDTPLSAVKPPNRFVSPETVSMFERAYRPWLERERSRRNRRGRLGGGRRGPLRRLTHGKRRGRRQRQEGLGGRHGLGEDQLELAFDDLEHGREGALVLPGEAMAGRVELHAIALHGAALRDIGVPGRLGQRLRGPAAVLGDGPRHHVVEQD